MSGPAQLTQSSPGRPPCFKLRFLAWCPGAGTVLLTTRFQGLRCGSMLAGGRVGICSPPQVPSLVSSRPMLIINQPLVSQHPDTQLASENEETSQRSPGTASSWVGLNYFGTPAWLGHTHARTPPPPPRPPAPLRIRTMLPGPWHGTSWGLLGLSYPIYKVKIPAQRPQLGQVVAGAL